MGIMKKAVVGTALAVMLATGGLLGQVDSFLARKNPSRVASLPGPADYVLVAQNGRMGASSQPLSLGELARKLQEERKAQGTKAVKVYTNDNIPQHGGISVTGTPEGQPAQSGTSKESPQASRKHGQAYFQKRAARIRSNLSLHQRELAVLEQQLGQARLTYYPNPQKTLDQESGPGFQSSANKLRQEIQAKKAQIAADEKDMQDLQEQLQRDGGDPGWIR